MTLNLCLFRSMKGDVAWFDVGQKNPHSGECCNDSLHPWPVIAILLHLLCLPLLNDIRRIFRLLVEYCSGKVKDVWRLNNLHFDTPVCIGKIDQSRNSAITHFADSQLPQSQVNISLAFKEFHIAERLDGRDFRSFEDGSIVSSSQQTSKGPVSGLGKRNCTEFRIFAPLCHLLHSELASIHASRITLMSSRLKKPGPIDAFETESVRYQYDFRHNDFACVLLGSPTSIADRWRIASHLGSWSGTLCFGGTPATGGLRGLPHRHNRRRATNDSHSHYSTIRTGTGIPLPAPLNDVDLAKIPNFTCHHRFLNAGGMFVNGAGLFQPGKEPLSADPCLQSTMLQWGHAFSAWKTKKHWSARRAVMTLTVPTGQESGSDNPASHVVLCCRLRLLDCGDMSSSWYFE